MDSDKYSTQVERLEVVETGRRRRWSDDEKLRIVTESFQTPRAISSTARRHGISRSLLMTWRRAFHAESMSPDIHQSGFENVPRARRATVRFWGVHSSSFTALFFVLSPSMK